jgi:hypothetical protein
MKQVQRIYVAYTDPSNFEAVEACDTDAGDKAITWVAHGTGSYRQPHGKIVGGEIVVSGVAIRDRNWDDPEPSTSVEGGAGLQIRLEE